MASPGTQAEGQMLDAGSSMLDSRRCASIEYPASRIQDLPYELLNPRPLSVRYFFFARSSQVRTMGLAT
jgi:hypothetical protein